MLRNNCSRAIDATVGLVQRGRSLELGVALLRHGLIARHHGARRCFTP